MRATKLIAVGVCLIQGMLISTAARSEDPPPNSLYVAPSGDDTKPEAGEFKTPFKTIQKCAEKAETGQACVIKGGTYREAGAIKPKNDGITFMPYKDERVIVDGSDLVAGKWNQVGTTKIYKTTITMRIDKQPTDDANQVFVWDTTNPDKPIAKMMTEAKWPNSQDLHQPQWAVAKAGTSATSQTASQDKDPNAIGVLVDSKLPNKNFVGARIYWWTNSWSGITGQVTSKVNASTLRYSIDGGIPLNDIKFFPKERSKYYIVGALDALDEAGEWFYDATTKELYFWAPNGVDPATLAVSVKARNYAFDLSGKSNIVIKNIAINASTILTDSSSTNNKIDGIDATYVSHFTRLKRHAGHAAYPSTAWNAHYDDSGIIINGFNNSLINSTISYSAGNGVVLLGSSSTVENNLIRYVNYMANYNAGVNVFGPDHKVYRNTIHTSGRAAIVLSNITNKGDAARLTSMPDNVDVAHNNIYDAMKFSYDGGAIYAAHMRLTRTSNIRNNFIHDVKVVESSRGDVPPGFTFASSGIYLDENPSNFNVRQNVIWNTERAGILIHQNKKNAGAINVPIVNNTLLDGMALSISPQNIWRCDSEIKGNKVKLAIPETSYSWDKAFAAPEKDCARINNDANQIGAFEMKKREDAGCKFAGCFSELPAEFAGAGSTPPVNSTPPVSLSITSQPSNVSALEGLNPIFRVSAQGSGTLTYQWKKNGVVLPNSNTPVYTASAASLSDDKSVFSVVVSNGSSSVTSSSAVLSVTPSPALNFDAPGKEFVFHSLVFSNHSPTAARQPVSKEYFSSNRSSPSNPVAIKWLFERVGAPHLNIYVLKVKGSNMALQVSPTKNVLGAKPGLSERGQAIELGNYVPNSKNQQFRFESVGSGLMKLTSLSSSLAVCAHWAGGFIQCPYYGGPHQKFTFVEAPTPRFVTIDSIKFQNNLLTNDRSPISLTETQSDKAVIAGGKAQVWELVPTGNPADKNFYIKLKGTNFAMQVSPTINDRFTDPQKINSNAQGQRIVLATHNPGAVNQMFKLRDAGGGLFKITSLLSQKDLEPFWKGSLNQNFSFGVEQQKFAITEVPAH